jgi:hypothetical protein
MIRMIEGESSADLFVTMVKYAQQVRLFPFVKLRVSLFSLTHLRLIPVIVW